MTFLIQVVNLTFVVGLLTGLVAGCGVGVVVNRAWRHRWRKRFYRYERAEADRFARDLDQWIEEIESEIRGEQPCHRAHELP